MNDSMSEVKSLAKWRVEVEDGWSDLSIEDVEVNIDKDGSVSKSKVKQPQLEVGSNLMVKATVKLGRLSADDIAVEIYHGIVDSAGNIEEGQVVSMNHELNGHAPDVAVFAGAIPATMSGKHGFAVRVLPRHDDLSKVYEPGLILWENSVN